MEDLNFASLEKRVLSYNPSADIALIRKAYKFAEKAHSGQHRVSGELFIFHPLGVAIILADLELDSFTIAAGLLHDVVEDTEYNRDIEREFEMKLLYLDGVTKLEDLNLRRKRSSKLKI